MTALLDYSDAHSEAGEGEATPIPNKLKKNIRPWDVDDASEYFWSLCLSEFLIWQQNNDIDPKKTIRDLD